MLKSEINPEHSIGLDELSKEQHAFYRGKIEISPKCRIASYEDFALWYSPGVAAPCRAISANTEEVYKYTNRNNNIAIISDGSRVLGLGDIGPEAALPVMEGKSLLFKYNGGVDAYPMCLDTKNPEQIIDIVKALQPNFSGINLEDIESPKCFELLARLQRECSIPVWHDDQQGTAAVILAGLINSLKLVKKNIADIRFVMFGAGASNIRIIDIIMKYGARADKIYVFDSKGCLSKKRADLEYTNPYKWDLCLKTDHSEDIDFQSAMEDADVLIALSGAKPGTITESDVSLMNKDAIVFACANPEPEIWPNQAKKAGAAIVATGRSDFPNQLNNSLGFPGIFRGVLDVRAKKITDEMCIAAAESIALTARKHGISFEYIVPRMDSLEVYVEEAVAVGTMAIKQGIADVKLSEPQLREQAKILIERARRAVEVAYEHGIISRGEK